MMTRPGRFRFLWQLTRSSDSAKWPSKCTTKLDCLLQSERVYMTISPSHCHGCTAKGQYKPSRRHLFPLTSLSWHFSWSYNFYVVHDVQMSNAVYPNVLASFGVYPNALAHVMKSTRPPLRLTPGQRSYAKIVRGERGPGNEANGKPPFN